MIKSAVLLLAGLLIITSEILPQKSVGNGFYKPTGTPSHSYLNLNNISTIFQNNGISDYDVTNGLAGFKFPKTTGRTAIYVSGLLWGAKIPGDPQPRVGGSAYRTGLQGGKIISPGVAEDTEAPHVRIYRVRSDVYPGGPLIDLSWEASDEGKTEEEVRVEYETDWVEWRAVDGAPYEDVDANGLYDPDIDIPGISGASQTIWFVANDLDPAKTGNLYGALPIGIEIQFTYWAYNNGNFLDNVLFLKYRLINKSLTSFNDMYISMWSDPDVGYPADLVGCDTTLNMAYAYNASDYDSEYDPYPPPAIGFDLLKGPVATGTDTLPMTAYYFFWGGDPNWGDPPQGDIQGSIEFYNFMQGRFGLSGEPFINPITGQPTTFALSGDPLTGDGWMDDNQFGGGDRRIGLASGPFNMAIGDTQEVVIAEIAAIGVDRLHSLKKLIYYDVQTQSIFDSGLNIFTPPVIPSPIAETSSKGSEIKLDWGIYGTSINEIENFNHSGYLFQGYNVYQLPNDLPIIDNAVRIATFDITDGVTEIEGVVMDPESGLAVSGIQQYGSDSGIRRSVSVNHDLFEDEEFIIGKTYYFAVTAYIYNPDPGLHLNNSESIVKVIEVVFNKELPGASYGDSIEVVHSQGSGFGDVYVSVTDPTKLTNNNYEIYFDKQSYYRNENGNWVPIYSGLLKSEGQNSPDTLTGSTIDIGAIYGPSSGVIELGCYFNNLSPDGNWADGISITFPPEVSIIDVPSFWTGGGEVIPEIIGNTVNFGIVDGSQTGNGIFIGGEEWEIYISSFQPPLIVDWIIFDDGFSGGAVNAVGSTTIDSIGYAFKTEHHWNLRNLTRQEIVLEDQTIIMGRDLYTYKYVGDPNVEGFQISVNPYYKPRNDFTELNITGSGTYDIDSYYKSFGGPSARSIDVYGRGTTDPIQLQKDYELRFTGIYEDSLANVVYIKDGTGSIATLYGARYYDLEDHPMNPNPGSNDPFTVRIPFEVWSIDDNRQVNILIYERVQELYSGEPWYAFNPYNRMYCELLPTAYHETVVDTSGTEVDSLTWNLVFWETDWVNGDLITIYYDGPTTSEDKFTFTTPKPPDIWLRNLDLDSYHLFQNYPNPLNSTTKIGFYIPKQGLVKLDVYDILGQRVAQLVNGEMNSGSYQFDFNSVNLASGVYIYLLNVKDKFFEAKKMLLLK